MLRDAILVLFEAVVVLRDVCVLYVAVIVQ
jgi:hypothetical protein